MGRTSVVALALLVVAGGCGSSAPGDACADAVIDWEDGPAPYATAEEAVAGFLDDFPELGRFADLEVRDGVIRSGGTSIGRYSVEQLADGTWGVTGAEWCYDAG